MTALSVLSLEFDNSAESVKLIIDSDINIIDADHNLKSGHHTSVYTEKMFEKGSAFEAVSVNLGLRYTF